MATTLPPGLGYTMTDVVSSCPSLGAVVALLLTLILSVDSAGTQPEITIDIGDLPAGLEMAGHLVDARRWEDAQGTNYMLLTRTANRLNPPDEYGIETQSARLYAYHYLQQGNGFRLLRQISDFIDDCELDMTVAHVPDSLAITDLDEDGLSEVSFLYELACRGDVSPPDLKLMMLENGEKYPIRGTSIVDVGNGERYGGEKRFGVEFDTAPVSFRRFAGEHWDRFVDSTQR